MYERVGGEQLQALFLPVTLLAPGTLPKHLRLFPPRKEATILNIIHDVISNEDNHRSTCEVVCNHLLAKTAASWSHLQLGYCILRFILRAVYLYNYIINIFSNCYTVTHWGQDPT